MSPPRRRGREDGEDGNLLSPKRPRLEEFAKGSIIKVRAVNFMTFVDVVVEPGPTLNVVLGPNGSGKSSLVCALCLGLGGNPKLLGRAEDPGDFIRHGVPRAEGCWTEITLSSGGQQRPVRVYHKISVVADTSRLREGATKVVSEWKLNGVASTKTKVLAMMKELNVQLDNLCQFLPQDKVASFAQLRPGELLIETERAIGDSSLHMLHLELIGARTELRRLESALAATEAELTTLQRQNEALRRDVERFEQRERLLQDVELRRSKLLWLEVKRLKAVALKSRDMAAKNTDKLDERTRELARQKGPFRAKEQALGHARTAFHARVAEAKRVERAFQGVFSNVVDLAEAVTVKKEELEGLRAQADQQLRQLQQAQAALEKAQADIDGLPPALGEASQGQANAETKRLHGVVRQLDMEKRGWEASRQELQEMMGKTQGDQQARHDQLARMGTMRGQRLQALEQRNRGIWQLANWVDQHRHEFKGHVLGPLACEVTVPNPLHAAYLEQQCRWDVWVRFVLVHREDQNLLLDKAREVGYPRAITTVYDTSSQDPAAPIQNRHGSAADLARFKVTHTMDEVFKAHPVVKRVLCDEAAIDATYIGGPDMDLDGLLANTGVTSVWHGDAQYRLVTSAYNARVRSSRTIPLRPAFLLAGDAAAGGEERAALEAQIAAADLALAAMHGEHAAMGDALNGVKERWTAAKRELKAHEDRIRKEKTARTRLMTALTAKTREVASLEKRPDPMAKQPALEREIKRLQTNASAAVTAMVAAAREQLASGMAKAVAEATMRELEMQVEALKGQTRNLDTAVTELRNLQRRLDEIRVHNERKFEEAKAKAEEKLGPKADWTEDFRIEMARLSDDATQLRNELDEKTAEADGIVCANEGVLEEYQERTRRVQQLTAQLEAETAELTTQRAAMHEKKGRWLPELQRIVGVISTDFARNLRRLRCAGEVRLAVPEGDDFERCAIEIWVKFRDEEELQRLSSHRQSGGERSVSTILYLIAIQNVTVCPFRVVDEINQGMDEANERRVFTQLAAAACTAGTPQCFLLTPKLLPQLPFTPECTVLQILNGPTLGNVDTGVNFSTELLMGRRTVLAGAA